MTNAAVALKQTQLQNDRMMQSNPEYKWEGSTGATIIVYLKLFKLSPLGNISLKCLYRNYSKLVARLNRQSIVRTRRVPSLKIRLGIKSVRRAKLI